MELVYADFILSKRQLMVSPENSNFACTKAKAVSADVVMVVERTGK
jgi:hypothetical protein